jgi:hypothetical protein
MLDKDAGIDPIAEFDQGLGGINLVATDRQVREIR